MMEPVLGVGHFASEDEGIWNSHAINAIHKLGVLRVGLEAEYLDAVLGQVDDMHPFLRGKWAQP